jgi:murein DD-endopeptidase MepM/ murein hydrolase activator NlpD
VVSRARLTRLACASRCGAAGAVHPGALLRVRGVHLRRTTEVRFTGAAGALDDVAAAPVARRKTSVDVRVPLGAASGAVTVVDRDGVASAPAPAALTVVAGAAPGGGPSIDVDVLAPKAYFDAERPLRVSYLVHDNRPVSVRVELVRQSDGAVIATWAPGVVAPETPQMIEWNGLAGGRAQKPGRYTFRVSAADEAGRCVRRAQGDGRAEAASTEPDPSEFLYLNHQFPIRGPHGYGEFPASFGGGRGHQGQDVFAACGTPLVAARGGRVKFKQYHSRAGPLPDHRRRADRRGLRLHAPRLSSPRRQGRPRPHRAADRLRRRHGRGQWLPPALRDVEGAGLVQRRLPVQPARQPAGLGSAVVGPVLVAARVGVVRGSGRVGSVGSCGHPRRSPGAAS